MESLQQCLILLIMGLLMLMCEGVHHDRIFQRGNVPTTKLCIYVVDMAKSQEGGPIHSDEDETTLELQPACRLLAQKPDARYRNLLKNLRDTNRQENIAKCQKVASVIDVKANARGLQAWVEDIGGCDLNRCPWCDANVASKKAFDTLEAKFAAWTIEIFKSLKNESLPMKVADAQHSNVTDDALTLQVEGYVKDNALSLRNSLKAWKTALAKLPSGSMVSRNGDSKVSSIKAATGLIASGAISSGVGNYLQRPKNQCDHYRLKSAEDEGSGAVVLKSSVGNSTIEVIPARFTTAAPASAYDASVYDMCPTEHTDSCDNPIKPTMGLWPLGTAHRTPCGKKYDHLVNSYVSTLEHGRKLIRHGIADSDLKARQLITLVGDGRRLTSPRVSSLSLVGIGPVESVFSGETKMAKAMKNHMLEAADAAHLDLSFLNLVSNGYYEIAGFEWSTFFKNIGINASRDFVSVNVVSLPYLRNITGLIAKTPIKKLKAYLKWHLVSSTSSFLSQPFLDEEFRHWGKTMAGREEPSPLWQDCVNAVTTLQPDAVGKEFVRRHFAGNSHELASEMLSLIVDRMTALLRGVHWMDEHTKEKALKKVSNMHLKVGFPSEWHSLEFDVTDSWFANNMLARTTDFRESIEKILHPVDKDKWSSPCSTVNAFYSPTNNGIVIPAGILQPPFFDHDFPMPMNFGAIGIVMGHEVTHGFDDKGRKFDPTGKLENWWPDDVSKEFDHRTHCVRDLYSGFKVQKDLNVNGNLTLGENIADMGGVKLAFAAYEEWASKTQPKHGTPFRQMRGALLPEDEKSPIQKAPSSVTPRLTNDQLFFVSFAQTWCTVRTEQSERTQVKTNVHSPAKFRVNGPLADFEPFAEAFNCPVGSRMRRPAKDRCDVW